VGILKRVIVSPPIYPHFLEIAELVRSAIAELLVCTVVNWLLILLLRFCDLRTVELVR